MLVDTHCHLTLDDLSPQVNALLDRAREAGVQRVITVATTPADARAALALMETHPQVFLAAGIHPHEAVKATPDDLNALADLHRGRWNAGEAAKHLVAVGETGLDFHYGFAAPEQQETLFRFQLELARETDRPVVIHARQAEEQVCDILADYPALAGRIVFHCFSGGPELARRILEMGSWLSFTGVVTFKNADTICAAARQVPNDRIMVETDAPFLSPEPVRKRRPCEPAFVVHTARHLADLREESFDAFAATTTRNAERFFKLPEE
ncbi:MAG: TatD family hydrolase [Phycisphaerae bacterium]